MNIKDNKKIYRTKAEMEEFVKQLMPNDYPDEVYWDGSTLQLVNEYEYVPFNFQIALDLLNFVGAVEVNDDKDYSSGCHTCDYGSQYTITLDFRYND